MFSDTTSHHIPHLYIGRQVNVTEPNVTGNFRMLCQVGVLIEVSLGNEPVGYTGLRLPLRQIPGT